jgi:CcmD family protein
VSYVAAAYLVTITVLALYAWTLWARQRELRRRGGE